MNISLILAHPNQGSFSHAIAAAAMNALRTNGHTVFFHDLYRENFDPVMTGEEIREPVTRDPLVEQHCAEIARADGIILVHPDWWGQPPAILKGWVDRVLRWRVAYDFEGGNELEGAPIGLLRARVGLVFNTTNTPLERDRDVLGNPLETLWKNCIFAYCGVTGFERRVFRILLTSTPQQRQGWLEEVQEVVGRHFPK